MGNRYAVKSAVITFGSATLELASAPVQKGETKEAVDVTALSDQVKQFIPGAVKEVDEFTVTAYYKGSGDVTVDDTPTSLSIAVTLENGNSDVTASVSYPKAIVTKVSPPSIDASGDRKATYDITFRPDGSAASSNS